MTIVEGSYSKIIENDNNILIKEVIGLGASSREYLSSIIKHPNIIPMRTEITNHSLRQVMNKIENSKYQTKSIYDLVRSMYSIGHALAFLHSCGLIHGDIKWPNILHIKASKFDSMLFNSSKIYLCDFSITVPCFTTNYGVVHGEYYHPEEANWSYWSDVYAFCILVAEWTIANPCKMSMEQFLSKLKESLHKELFELIKLGVSIDYKRRPTMRDILICISKHYSELIPDDIREIPNPPSKPITTPPLSSLDSVNNYRSKLSLDDRSDISSNTVLIYDYLIKKYVNENWDILFNIAIALTYSVSCDTHTSLIKKYNLSNSIYLTTLASIDMVDLINNISGESKDFVWRSINNR